MTKALATLDHQRIAESLVTRGDVSGLNPQEKTRFYLDMCKSLGLNPTTQPLAFMKLNGKEILYVTRGATDQLARNHNLNREIVEGPDVRDFAGTKLLYAKCRATLPNGRIETAVATLPLTDIAMATMKVESKAKRRATLSILGLGMLDELEVQSIPAHQKQTVEQVDMETGEVIETPKALPPAQPTTAKEAGVLLAQLKLNGNNQDEIQAEFMRLRTLLKCTSIELQCAMYTGLLAKADSSTAVKALWDQWREKLSKANAAMRGDYITATIKAYVHFAECTDNEAIVALGMVPPDKPKGGLDKPTPATITEASASTTEQSETIQAWKAHLEAKDHPSSQELERSLAKRLRTWNTQEQQAGIEVFMQYLLRQNATQSKILAMVKTARDLASQQPTKKAA